MSNAISKAYNSIKELPSEVRSSFDETDQKKWMDAYNEASQNEEPEQAKVDAWMKMVDAPSSLAVETWGSVEVRDADGELVPVDTIANYADKFIENGGLMHDSHSNVPVGTVWNWDVRKHPETGQDGIVFYFNIYRDGEVFERARDDILSGRKQAVSIGAEAPRGGYKCDDRGCYVERDVTDLYELSICETPANPEAYFINVGKDIAKAKQPLAGEKMRFNVKDVVVHQDYTTCPLQKCKKVLRDKGYKNIHISDDGKVLAKSINNEYRLFKAISKLGYPFRYDLQKQQFEIIPDYGVEQAIEEALGNGWAHEDNIGHVTLTRDIPKEIFLDWFDRGFIVKIGDNYCLKADDVAKTTNSYDVQTPYGVIPITDSGSNFWRGSNEELEIEVYVKSGGETQIKVTPTNANAKEFQKTLPYVDISEGILWAERGANDIYSKSASSKKKVKKNDVAKSRWYDTISATELYEKIKSEDNGLYNPWDAFCEQLSDWTKYVMQKYGIPEEYESLVNDILFTLSYPEGGIFNSNAEVQIRKFTKKKVKKDAGAMGVGDAGASNPVYGSKPTSLVTPTGDKKFGRKRKAKKEMTDDGNIHAVGSKKV